jgi:hypothetical protein
MTVKYVPMDGARVSEQWYVLLNDIRNEDHVAFHVNQGKRTIAEQAAFYWRWLHVPGAPLAAKPTPNAPHIREGRFDHAIDFFNAEGVRRAAARRGVTLTRTVLWPDGTVREEWHLEASAAQLERYYEAHKGDPIIWPFYVKPYRLNDRDAVTRLQRLLRGLHLTNVVNGKYGIWTRRAVRKFQHKHGLKADGIVGPATWKALRKAQG